MSKTFKDSRNAILTYSRAQARNLRSALSEYERAREAERAYADATRDIRHDMRRPGHITLAWQPFGKRYRSGNKV